LQNKVHFRIRHHSKAEVHFVEEEISMKILHLVAIATLAVTMMPGIVVAQNPPTPPNPAPA
jgi:hypothetical protein